MKAIIAILFTSVFLASCTSKTTNQTDVVDVAVPPVMVEVETTGEVPVEVETVVVTPEVETTEEVPMVEEVPMTEEVPMVQDTNAM